MPEEELRGSTKLETTKDERRLFTEDELLPVSRLADLEFCERRAALHLVEMTWEDSVRTVEGSIIHERVHGDETPEKRGELIILRGLWVRSFRLGMIGKADVVELHRAGVDDAIGISIQGHPGRWVVCPVEYKPGQLKHQRSFQIQLCAQAMCLEEMLKGDIPVGALFYGKTRRRLEIAFDDKLRRETEAAARRLHELLESNITPKAEKGPKCEQCSLLDLCLPRVTGAKREVAKYLAKTMDERE